jgi:hypothetical protein
MLVKASSAFGYPAFLHYVYEDTVLTMRLSVIFFILIIPPVLKVHKHEKFLPLILNAMLFTVSYACTESLNQKPNEGFQSPPPLLISKNSNNN